MQLFPFVCSSQVELEDGEVIGYVSVLESGTMQEEADSAANKIKRKAAKQVLFVILGLFVI